MNLMSRPLVSADRYVAAMGMAVTGVSIVTTDGPAGRFGLTVSAIASVSADPPMVLVCINRKSPAAAAILGNSQFAVNLLAADGQACAETFAGRPRDGRPFDFAAHSWKLGESGMALAEGASAAFECQLATSQEAGTHHIFIGRVVAAHKGSAEPLVYCNRAFRRIATH